MGAPESIWDQYPRDEAERPVSVRFAARLLLARVATNVGADTNEILDSLARELIREMPVYGAEGGAERPARIGDKALRFAQFRDGAEALATADGRVFTQLSVRYGDLAGYLARLERLDLGHWNAA